MSSYNDNISNKQDMSANKRALASSYGTNYIGYEKQNELIQ